VEKKKITRFEDLTVWQEGVEIATSVYKLLKNCRDYGLRDQMQRSAVSISSNIAEGFERRSNKSFIHFLNIANGSTGELRTQLYIAKRIGLISNKESDKMINKTNSVSKMIYRLVQTRRHWESKK